METDRTRHSRALWASFVGTGIEFYDFYIYATAASLVFGQIFFPPGNPGLQQMLSFATLAVAFFARPVGAAVFGHYGDRIGRKAVIWVSILGVAQIALHTRAKMTEIMQSDFVLYARAQGGTTLDIVLRHGVRGAEGDE